MPSLVELQYHPYIPRLKVLLNGKQPPDFSQLVQYTDEDIWLWSSQILNSIYSEIRDDFYIEFTGTNSDAEILRYECSQNPHCLAFKEQSFTIKDSMQKRLGQLNQFIKKNGILGYPKTIIDAHFLVPQNVQHVLDDITSIDIGNLFCAVRIETSKGNGNSYEDGEHTYLFSLADSFEIGLKNISRIKHQNPAFIICLGKADRFCGIKGNVFFYETTEENLLNTVFQCFLNMPLLLVFRECINAIPHSYRNHDDFIRLSLVEPEIIIDVASRIEAGKSVPIKVSLNPPIGNTPKLEYHAINCAVADCDGMSVFGKAKGRTTLEVYRYGEKKPFYTQDIDVFVRNRITKIILSEDDITLGVGDAFRLRREYVPDNADNVNQIIWKSSNEQVAKVDQTGRVLATGAGSCKIICSAENTSAVCYCRVKPYLEEIITDIEGNCVLLRPAQELKVATKLNPPDCVDGTLEYVSSNYDIVNIVGNTLMAKNEGTATVTIQNKTKRRSVSISVTVEKEKKKKTGFFQSLFHKE